MKSYPPPEPVPARYGAVALYKNVVRLGNTARRDNGLMFVAAVALAGADRLRNIRRH